MRKLLLSVVLSLAILAFSGRLDGKIIVVDPGHGGPNDRGAVTENGLEEAVINLKVAFYLRELLEEEGAVVVMTRTSDVPVSLKDRVELANRLNADLFLCLHHNYMETNRKADFSIVYFPSRAMDYSINLAHILSEEFEKYVGTKPGDVGPGDVYVMRNIRVPGILGEPCLMSNPEREKWLREDENLRLEAEAYKDAVLKLFSQDIPHLFLDSDTIGKTFRVVSDVPLKSAGAFLDVKPLEVEISGSTELILKVPDDVPPGRYELYVYAVSKDGVYSRSIRKTVKYSPSPNEVKMEIFPKIAPAVAGSYFLVKVEVLHSGQVLDTEPSLSLDKGFIAQAEDGYVVPYMGYDEVVLKLKVDGIEKEVKLHFEGKERVRVIFLRDEDGNPLGVVEYRGGKMEISKEGYQTTHYESNLTEPVSFDVVILKKTLEGIFKGKTIGIAFPPELEEKAKELKEKLEKLGAEVIMKGVKSTRDVFKTARAFNKEADAVVILDLSETKLKKFLKVPCIISDGEDLEGAVKELSSALR